MPYVTTTVSICCGAPVSGKSTVRCTECNQAAGTMYGSIPVDEFGRNMPGAIKPIPHKYRDMPQAVAAIQVDNPKENEEQAEEADELVTALLASIAKKKN